jgi:hypothetical protein
MVDRSAEKSSKNFEVLVRVLRGMAETRKWDQANEGKRDRERGHVLCGQSYYCALTRLALHWAYA